MSPYVEWHLLTRDKKLQLVALYNDPKQPYEVDFLEGKRVLRVMLRKFNKGLFPKYNGPLMVHVLRFIRKKRHKLLPEYRLAYGKGNPGARSGTKHHR